jgi:hypothetical protein
MPPAPAIDVSPAVYDRRGVARVYAMEKLDVVLIRVVDGDGGVAAALAVTTGSRLCVTGP